MQIIYKCCDYYNNQGAVTDIAERQERLKSCGNRCLKNVSLHRTKQELTLYCIALYFISTVFLWPSVRGTMPRSALPGN